LNICVLLFLLVQPLHTDSMVCPSSCMCNLEGAVKCLHLDYNRLESIAPVLFEGLANLNELDVSNNAIAHLAPNVFHGLSSLRYLNLGRNSLQQLPPTLFHSLTQLQFLMLYNNKLERLEVGAFDELANLLELKLHNNQIAYISPEVFWALGNLMTLTMSSNLLQGVPNESFYHLPKLTKLTIYKNPLLSLPDKLMGQMPRMKEFYLYDTNLSTVPWNLFANMSGMERLSLHLNNKLRELPPDLFYIFSKLANMDTLLLNDNKLRSLSEDIFKGNPSLASIELKNNQLRTLPGEVFSTAGGLRVVTLSGNPWDCRCGIRDIASWIKLNEGVVSDRTDVICRNPYPLLLRPLGSLLNEEFKCDVTTPSSSRSTRSSIELSHAVSTTALEEQEVVDFTATTTAPEAPSTQQTENPTESVRFTTPGTRRTTAATPTADVLDILDDDYIFKPMGTESLPVHVLSPPFHDRLVFENGLEFVHNNRLKGWVYLWTLQPNGAYVGFLMALHILLVATGVALILAAMYGMYRLHQATEDLGAILTNRKHAIISERKQKDGCLRRAVEDKL
uniref:LRRCT domain-containing protein n=1 Tax=Oncorhynchus tshawytscha TaxID=74940 RepID=A0A8C8K7Y6_ONCTS